MKFSWLGLLIGFFLFTDLNTACAQKHVKDSRWGIQFGGGNPFFVPSFADFAPTYEALYFYEVGFVYLPKLNEKWGI